MPRSRSTLVFSATEHKALDLLSRAGSMTAGQLAELSGLTTGAVDWTG